MRWLSNPEAQTLPGKASKLMVTTYPQCQGRQKHGSSLSVAVRATLGSSISEMVSRQLWVLGSVPSYPDGTLVY